MRMAHVTSDYHLGWGSRTSYYYRAHYFSRDYKSTFYSENLCFSFSFYTKFITNKDIFHGNWEIGLGRILGIYFRISKTLFIWLY